MAFAGTPSGSLFAEGGAGTLRLLGYLLAATLLMVADHRGGHLEHLRSWLTLLNEPLYRAAAAPVQLAAWLHDGLQERVRLREERDRHASALLLAHARLARMEAIQRENQRLRELLGGTRGLGLHVQLARLVDIELDPFRHRVVLDRGDQHGLRPGLAVIDARGVVGQVVETSALSSTALLISDPSHALPVQLRRSGLRTIAFGSGEAHRLLLPNIPQSADIQVGDELLTSGLGGRFPAGLPVGRITRLTPDDTRLFVVAEAAPAAALNRSGEVLLVWESAGEDAAVGPPAELAAPPAAQP